MPTNKQRQYVAKKITSKGSSEAEIIRDVGYTECTARQPHKVTQSLGVQQLLAEATQGSEWLSPTGIKKCIERAVKSEYGKSKADTILRFYQLQVHSQAKNITQDNRSVTVNPEPEKLDKQAHIYIAQKYNITVPELKKRLARRGP